MAHNSNYLAKIEAYRKPFDGLVTQEVVRRFESERHMVKAAVKMAPTPQTIENHAQIAIFSFTNLNSWNETMMVTWRVTADYFAAMTDMALREKYLASKATEPHDVKVSLGTWTDAVDQYIINIAGSKIKHITDTTLNDIRATVGLGMAAGESVEEIANDIDLLYREDIIPFRAPIIARTEVAAASNYGNRMAAKDFERDLLKRWVPILDNNTRDAHAAMAMEEWYQIDDPYIVGGELLMFPGDTSMGASAWNIVNCRCTEIYKPAVPREMEYDQ
jgi:uncharacterized protein with gpF-like domain